MSGSFDSTSRLTALGVAQNDKIEVETQGRKIVEL